MTAGAVRHPGAVLRWLRLALWLALVLALVQGRVLPHVDAGGTSFPGYWTVARLVVEGVPAVQLYDDAWLAAQLAERGFPADRMLGPPSLALTLVPLAWLPYPLARAAWMLGVLLPALVGSLWWLGRRLGPWTGLAFAALWGLGRPVEAGLEVAQVYPVLLLLHCVGLWGWERDRPAVGGLGLAPMMFVRGWHGLPQAVGWLWSGRWRGFAWAIGLAAGMALLSVPVLGLAGWEHFLLIQAREVGQSDAAMATAYQTWRSLSLHLTTLHPVYSPDPPLLGWGRGPWLVGVGLIGAGSLWAGRRLGQRPLGFALWTCVALLLAPFAEDHQVLLLALPSAVLWAEAPRLRPLVLLALPLLLLDTDFERPGLTGGWRALLAYPRVYGAGLLWLGCLLAAWREPAAQRGRPRS